jgi:molybdate transport system ATP-binding protein
MSFEQQSSILVRDFLSYDHVMDINPYEVTDLHDTARPAFERRMRRAIRLLGLREFLSRTLLSLSNGERQRVELAKALSGPLRLLILDEPYTGLDAETRRHFHSFLESLLSTPLRVILITTHLEELPRHITHVIRVEECKVVAAGLRKEILPTAPAGKRLKTKVRKGHSAAVSSRRPVECLVQLRDLTVRYGPRTILDRVSWTIHRGQSWVLLGPNGSGKTTLLSLITGDNPQTYTNDVVVFGKRLGNGQSIWRLKRQIGWLSPELQLHFDDNASVWQVVLSGFRDTIGIVDRPTTAQKKAATYWLKRFGLLKTANLSLFSLSAGSQRMVLLARALVKKPTLLVLDEPCQGLDSAHRELLIRIIDSLIAAKTTTAIFVTHRIEEVPGSITKALRLSPAGKASVEDFDRSRV